MRHDWVCCNVTVEVERSMDDFLVPPKASCPTCGKNVWRKKLAAPQGFVRGGGSASGTWPLRVKGIYEKDGKTPVLIKDEAQYRRELESRNLVNMNDGYDSAVGPSQHSVFDRPDPAPSARAEKMLAESKFLSEADLIGE